uniref:Uncharacterized protein n=1 Tax=Amphimedon queenslandica TaxID=400682 RepID=A0A1X7UEL2_AMPQE
MFSSNFNTNLCQNFDIIILIIIIIITIIIVIIIM